MIARITGRQNAKAWLKGLALFFSGCLVAGCSGPAPPSLAAYVPPDEFADDVGTWQRVTTEISNADNNRIGKFFQANPALMGSPDWMGTPVKYTLSGDSQTVRFCWFVGSSDNPSWNAIEFRGSKFRPLSGLGPPGGA